MQKSIFTLAATVLVILGVMLSSCSNGAKDTAEKPAPEPAPAELVTEPAPAEPAPDGLAAFSSAYCDAAVNDQNKFFDMMSSHMGRTRIMLMAKLNGEEISAEEIEKRAAEMSAQDKEMMKDSRLTECIVNSPKTYSCDSVFTLMATDALGDHHAADQERFADMKEKISSIENGFGIKTCGAFVITGKSMTGDTEEAFHLVFTAGSDGDTWNLMHAGIFSEQKMAMLSE